MEAGLVMRRKYSSLNRKGGFTLIELIVVMAIIGILFLALGSFLIINIQMFNSSETQTEIQTQAQTGMDSISNYLISVRSVSDSATPNPAYSGTTFQKIIMRNSDNTETTITYDTVNDQLKMSTGSDTHIIANNITAFNIEPLSAELPNDFANCIGLRITLTVTINKQKVNLTNEVFFRNKV